MKLISTGQFVTFGLSREEWGILLTIKRMPIFCIITLILTLLSDSTPLKAAPKTQFSIVYTNDVMGEVEPCG